MSWAEFKTVELVDPLEEFKRLLTPQLEVLPSFKTEAELYAAVVAAYPKPLMWMGEVFGVPTEIESRLDDADWISNPSSSPPSVRRLPEVLPL